MIPIVLMILVGLSIANSLRIVRLKRTYRLQTQSILALTKSMRLHLGRELVRAHERELKDKKIGP